MFSKEVQLIVNRLVDKLEYEAKKQAPRKHIQKPVDRAAYLTGISKRTIFRIRNKQKGDTKDTIMKRFDTKTRECLPT